MKHVLHTKGGLCATFFNLTSGLQGFQTYVCEQWFFLSVSIWQKTLDLTSDSQRLLRNSSNYFSKFSVFSTREKRKFKLAAIERIIYLA